MALRGPSTRGPIEVASESTATDAGAVDERILIAGESTEELLQEMLLYLKAAVLGLTIITNEDLLHIVKG